MEFFRRFDYLESFDALNSFLQSLLIFVHAEISVEELIAARHREIQDMVAATQNQFEMRMGSERYEQILVCQVLGDKQMGILNPTFWSDY